MIHYISMVLVIWGLIVQPLSAAIPVQMDHSTHYTKSSDTGRMAYPDGYHNSALNAGESSRFPCHENAVDEPSSEICDNCDINCANGLCASSCVVSGAVAVQNSGIKLDLKGRPPVTTSPGARTFGLPSPIFHPPKHS